MHKDQRGGQQTTAKTKDDLSERVHGCT
jgi:hypothetical protein